MDTSRPTKQIVDWDHRFFLHYNLPTWFSEVEIFIQNHNMFLVLNQNHVLKQEQLVLEKIKQSMLIKQNFELKDKCYEMPKLRTFVRFKDFTLLDLLLYFN